MDLISRQTALDAFGLSEKTRKYGGDHSGYDTMMLCEIQDILDELPSAEQWIPCSERLPDKTKANYWVCTDSGYQCECRWTDRNPIWSDLITDWHWNFNDIPRFSQVVAWMPLPDPWNGGET